MAGGAGFNCCSVRRQGADNYGGPCQLALAAGDPACHHLTMNRVRTRRGDQAPGGYAPVYPIRVALAVSFSAASP